MTEPDLDQLCVNTIRGLCMDAVQKANSGHPGTPMGIAPVAYTLWQRYLRFDPADPIWPNRDRFVLSEGPRLRRCCGPCSTSPRCRPSTRITRSPAARP